MASGQQLSGQVRNRACGAVLRWPRHVNRVAMAGKSIASRRAIDGPHGRPRTGDEAFALLPRSRGRGSSSPGGARRVHLRRLLRRRGRPRHAILGTSSDTLRSPAIPTTKKIVPARIGRGQFYGGSAGDRTRDHQLKRLLLYRLSYRPICNWRRACCSILACNTRSSKPSIVASR